MVHLVLVYGDAMNIPHEILEVAHEWNSTLYEFGLLKPNYPVPAIDYYNSSNPDHIPIGNVMEWSIPVDVQLKHRV